MLARILGPMAAFAGVLVLASSAALTAAEEPATAARQANAQKRDQSQNQQQEKKVQSVTTYRVSTLTGMNVKNREGKDIGQIEDLLVDIHDGQIGYAILSFGGFFGIGDKWFPIPWRELTVYHDEQESYLVADVSKQFLETAPSFDSKDFPDMTADWQSKIDAIFPTQTGKVMSVADDRLVLSLGEMGEHSYPVASNVMVTRDGAKVELDQVKSGDQAKVKTREEAGIRIVTHIDAHSTRTVR